jgi:putative ABC transport system permease protein
MLRLIGKSLWNRRGTAMLTVFSIMVSVMLLLGVEQIRKSIRSSFASAVSGTDLIVGARGGSLQLLLYSVFRIGNAPNNLSWESYEAFRKDPRVRWTIPLSLGDSHRGFRVLGTTPEYFQHFRYGRRQRLRLAEGQVFRQAFDTVLGAEVARKLGYRLSEKIVIAHGTGSTSFLQHEDRPFTVVGILAPTGTPVDQTVHVSLEGIEAMHLDWESGVPPMEGEALSQDEVLRHNLEPEAITAFLVGLRSRIQAFQLQRDVNTYSEEPLSAILPGATLQELWELLRVAETGLRVISGFVVLAGLLGMLTALLAGLNERRREMAILRSVGAGPGTVSVLLIGEAGLLTLIGVASGTALLYAVLYAVRPLLSEQLGLFLPLEAPGALEGVLLSSVFCCGVLIGGLPAWRAYRQSLADGMIIRL